MGFRRIEHDFSDLNDLLISLNSCKPESVRFVTCPKQGREMEAVDLHRVGFLAYPCPKQGREMEAVVLHRVGFLAYPCPKQGQDFKPST